MDIFSVQTKLNGDIKKSIVVELKSPIINISYKELAQVKTYMQTIIKEDRFKTNKIEWDFILVGNKINEDIKNEIKNSKHHGEKSLVYKVDNIKIYVKTWSDIFTEQEINLNFLNEKLKLQQEKLIDETQKQTPKEILESTKTLSPKEITIK